MPVQQGYMPGSFGLYNGYRAAPRGGASVISRMARAHQFSRGPTAMGPRFNPFRNRQPSGSIPGTGWSRGTPGRARASASPYIVSPATPGRSRVRKRLRYDGDPMEYEGGGMYYGRGRYRRKGIYKKRRMRRY